VHFRNPQRERGIQINHHDFLDAAFVHKAKDNSRRTFFSNVGGKSLDNPYAAYPIPELQPTESNVDLGRDRLVQSRKNYTTLQKNSYQVNLNKEKA